MSAVLLGLWGLWEKLAAPHTLVTLLCWCVPTLATSNCSLLCT